MGTKQRAIKRKSSLSFYMLSNTPTLHLVSPQSGRSTYTLSWEETLPACLVGLLSPSLIMKNLKCSKNKTKEPMEFLISVIMFLLPKDTLEHPRVKDFINHQFGEEGVTTEAILNFFPNAARETQAEDMTNFDWRDVFNITDRFLHLANQYLEVRGINPLEDHSETHG